MRGLGVWFLIVIIRFLPIIGNNSFMGSLTFPYPLLKETIVHNFQYFIPPHLGFPLGIKEGGICARG